ncbi:CHAD domain-containing protein [Cellvibrio mixtus]|uniref:CHAD domain-containing protein n=1 Tax=Cellvibrio mixtus TaxID=39650 RepID=UPI0005880057|nr:CHAD domain-containing protein [Cellvibrio mixtus]
MNADMPAEDAVRIMALEILNIVESYVDGTVNDLDAEFLHQYRVNFRKLRSLISLLKTTLPEKTMALLKARFSLVFRRTNVLRNLDVFLLEEERYREMLPEGFKDGLSELYTLIRKQRKEEQRKVARYFSSRSYALDIAACSKKLSAPPVYETRSAAKPILKVVKKLLLNRYQKILKISAGINAGSADSDIHGLRIEFKKFRYLIDLFSGFFPKKRLSGLMENVKKIQTVLGDFNDYSTQIMLLKEYVDDSRLEMSKSLCGLIAVLHQKQTKEKKKVGAALERFFTKKMSGEIDFIFG